MNTYTKDTTPELLRIIDMLTADKNALLRDGFKEAAEQDQQVIDAIIAELKSRSEVVA
jgi:hypothetical protein